MKADPTVWRAWMTKAEHDLLDVRNNLKGRQVPWDTVCFHSQQAVEKMLKALLVYHGKPVQKTHDFVSLLADCAHRDASLASLEEACRWLNAYAVDARYPGEIVEPKKAQGMAAANYARAVRRAVLRRLPQGTAARRVGAQ